MIGELIASIVVVVVETSEVVVDKVVVGVNVVDEIVDVVVGEIDWIDLTVVSSIDFSLFFKNLESEV